MKLFDSEWKVMEVLWQDGDTTAKELSLRLADSERPSSKMGAASFLPTYPTIPHI